MTTANVVDLSKWQSASDVNWPELVKAGVKAALIQLSHGMEYEPEAKEHIANAEKYGVIWHGYHYYQGDLNEVAFSVSNAQSLGLSKNAFMFLDMEGSITGDWQDQFYKFRSAWLAAGWRTGVYLSDSPYIANFDNDQIVADKVYRWIASYGKEPANYDVWQMTGSDGPLIGANTIVMDRNYDKTGALVVAYIATVAGGVGFKSTATGGKALMYSPDNVNFNVALSPLGWMFNQDAGDRMWPYIKDKIKTVSNGYVDTRETNETPDWYHTNYPAQTAHELKLCSAIDIVQDSMPDGVTLDDNSLCALITETPYSDNTGGWSYQTAKLVNVARPVVLTRVGTADDTWSDWEVGTTW